MSDFYSSPDPRRAEVNALHAEIAALRADLAKAREEVKRLTLERDGYETGVRAANRISQALEARALAAERARDEAVAEVKFYQDREAYYAKLLNVTDGGRYRADWAGAVDRLKLARDEAVAEIAERAETEKSLTAMVVEVQSERDEAVAALREAAELLREDAKEHHRPNGWTKAADWNEKKAAEWDALISRVRAASTGEAK